MFSSILCQRLFHIINKHGVKYWFSSIPGVGYEDVTFAIMILLHMNHNHNLPTYVAFVNLVEVFVTVNHDLLMEVLKRYGATPKLRSSYAIMYTDLEVVLKIVKLKQFIEKIVGVRQGD